MKSFGSKPWMLPQPVLIIGTYNESGVANAMNAAWGGTWDMHEIMISMGNHATTDNLKLNNGEFTVAFATAETMVASDFVGIVSAKNDPEKMSKTGLTAEKAPNINAPLFKEFPMTMECHIKEKIDESETGYYIVAEVVNVLCDERFLNEQGNPDVEKMKFISYEPVNHKYIQMGKVIGDAFSCGKIKRQCGFVDELRTDLFPLYKELNEIINNSKYKDTAYFSCAQWGTEFPLEPRNGLMFYGRATNGWDDDAERSAESMLSDNENTLFNRKNQMEWMRVYNTPFIQLMKEITCKYYAGIKEESWYQHVAWSNVFKVSFEEGNSDEYLCGLQFKTVGEIVKTELHHISPKVAIFITGNIAGETWHDPIDDEIKNNLITQESWNDGKCEAALYKYNGQYIIITDRPEFRERTSHVAAIMKLIKIIKNNNELSK